LDPVAREQRDDLVVAHYVRMSLDQDRVKAAAIVRAIRVLAPVGRESQGPNGRGLSRHHGVSAALYSSAHFFCAVLPKLLDSRLGCRSRTAFSRTPAAIETPKLS
jgi:hypothetical protein